MIRADTPEKLENDYELQQWRDELVKERHLTGVGLKVGTRRPAIQLAIIPTECNTVPHTEHRFAVWLPVHNPKYH